jgi:hypothetical protein
MKSIDPSEGLRQDYGHVNQILIDSGLLTWPESKFWLLELQLLRGSLLDLWDSFVNTNFNPPSRTSIISTNGAQIFILGIIPVQKLDLNPFDPTKSVDVTNYVETWLGNNVYV